MRSMDPKTKVNIKIPLSLKKRVSTSQLTACRTLNLHRIISEKDETINYVDSFVQRKNKHHNLYIDEGEPPKRTKEVTKNC
jgi:hypothetical protein